MTVLVLGGGQVATAMCRKASASHAVIGLTRSQLDITDASSVAESFARFKPDWVINAAAYTAVDRAEDEPAQARAVNDAAVAILAESAQREGAKLLHLSTDFVFDGKSARAYLPGDAANPVNVYGITKLAGEQHVLAGRTGIVLRTSWVYAAAGKNFVLTMLRLMSESEQINVVCDQIGTPTWAASVAAAAWGLIDVAAEGGVYHWADLGVASWYDFAVAIHDEALERGLLARPVSILPIPSANYPTRAARPGFSVLDTSSTRITIKNQGRHWRHNLMKMLDEIRAA